MSLDANRLPNAGLSVRTRHLSTSFFTNSLTRNCRGPSGTSRGNFPTGFPMSFLSRWFPSTRGTSRSNTGGDASGRTNLCRGSTNLCRGSTNWDTSRRTNLSDLLLFILALFLRGRLTVNLLAGTLGQSGLLLLVLLGRFVVVNAQRLLHLERNQVASSSLQTRVPASPELLHLLGVGIRILELNQEVLVTVPLNGNFVVAHGARDCHGTRFLLALAFKWLYSKEVKGGVKWLYARKQRTLKVHRKMIRGIILVPEVNGVPVQAQVC